MKQKLLVYVLVALCLVALIDIAIIAQPVQAIDPTLLKTNLSWYLSFDNQTGYVPDYGGQNGSQSLADYGSVWLARNDKGIQGSNSSYFCGTSSCAKFKINFIAIRKILR